MKKKNREEIIEDELNNNPSGVLVELSIIVKQLESDLENCRYAYKKAIDLLKKIEKYVEPATFTKPEFDEDLYEEIQQALYS